MMSFLHLTLDSPAANLALDEALLLEAEAGQGGEVLRIWELPTFAVVLGSAGIAGEDVNVQACNTDGVPILRRCSGGGTVLLGPGCLLFSLILSYERALALGDVTHSYTYILSRVASALGQGAQAGSSDLAAGDLKFSGNSQRRMRTHILHHGTVLFGFDTKRIARYLPLPSRQPAYRAGREHDEFVANLPLPRPEIVTRLRAAWQADTELVRWPEARTQGLTAEKYQAAGWTWRR